MVGIVDRLTFVAAEVADNVFNYGPELFPEAICVIKFKELMKIWCMASQGLIHVGVQIADVGLISLMVSCCCLFIVRLNISS